jgi:phage protein D
MTTDLLSHATMRLGRQGAPSFSISVEGRPIPPLAAAAVTELEVSSRAGAPSSFTVGLNDPDGKLVSPTSGLFAIDKLVAISVGYSGGTDREIVRGRVTAISAESEPSEAPAVRVEGFDLLHPLTETTHCRVFAGKDGAGVADSEIVERIAKDHGLQASVTQTTTRQRPRIQANISDYAFLMELAVIDDRDIFLDQAGRLAFIPQADTDKPPIDVAWGQTLLSYTARETRAAQVAQVVVLGWDSVRGQHVTARTSEPLNGGDVLTIDDYPVDSVEEAQRLADVVLAARRSGRVTTRCTLLGNPDVEIGRSLNVTGNGRFAATYVIREVTHRISDDGFVTKVEALRSSPADANGTRRIGEPGTWRPAAARLMDGVVPGVVKAADDKQGLGRVLVQVPLFGDDVELWAQPCLPGCDTDSGLHVFSDTGAQVLVAFELGDPSRPYVLGGVWNQGAKPPAMDTHDGKDETRPDVWLMRSRAGHQLRLDDTDDNRHLQLADADGAGLEIDTEQGEALLTAIKKLGIDVKDGSISLTAENIEINATDKLVVKGKQGTSVESSEGDVTVKGQNINLN